MSEDLARRAVACPGWRWLPGMRAIGGCVVATGCPLWLVDGVPRMPVDGEYCMWLRETGEHPDVLPDLDDPATRGALLALVREAYGKPGIHARQIRDQIWGVFRDPWRKQRPIAIQSTEAEALVAALEASNG